MVGLKGIILFGKGYSKNEEDLYLNYTLNVIGQLFVGLTASIIGKDVTFTEYYNDYIYSGWQGYWVTRSYSQTKHKIGYNIQLNFDYYILN